MRRSLATFAVAAILAAACSDPTSLPPDDYELPPPDEGLEPARVSIGQVFAHPCVFHPNYGGGTLDHLRDRREWATVDVFFHRMPENTQTGGPTEQQIARIRDYGGRVLYRFNVPGVRARLFVPRIADLVTPRSSISVYTVPDASRYDVGVIVRYTWPVGADDEAVIASLGGRVAYRADWENALVVELPDRSIPVLRARDGVQAVELPAIICL